MTLQDQLDAFRANFETRVAPPEAVAIIHRTTAELVATGQAANALGVGDRVPDFDLSDSEGQRVRLADLLATGPVALTFYRGVWCPYCNLDLKAIEAQAATMRAAGAHVVAISPQTPLVSRKARRDNGLSFPILADVGNAVADAFGLKFRLQDELIALYAGFGIDLSAVNGDDSQSLPMPARYVIGRDGVIAYAEVNADYTRRPDPSELLPSLKRLQSATAH